MLPTQTPTCYGHLYSDNASECSCCLLQDECCEAMKRPKRYFRAILSDTPVPKDTNKLILAICAKYGISTTYTNAEGKSITVRPEDASAHNSIAHLLTTRAALEALYKADIRGS